jgi:hypothetical protein
MQYPHYIYSQQQQQQQPQQQQQQQQMVPVLLEEEQEEEDDGQPLSNVHWNLLKQLRERMIETGLANRFRPQEFNDRMCLRWLKARRFDVNKAFEMLRAHCEWRDRNSIEKYCMAMCPSVLDTTTCMFMGEDIYHRPTIVVTPSRHVPSSLPLDQVEKMMVLTLEVAIRSLKCKDGYFVLIFDYDNWGLRNIDRGIDSLMISVGQSHYPERLKEAILVQPPWYFSTVWAVIKLFLDEKTKNKVQFLHRNVREELTRRYTPENLLRKYGGTSDGMTIRQYLLTKLRDENETLGEYIDRVYANQPVPPSSQ